MLNKDTKNKKFKKDNIMTKNLIVSAHKDVYYVASALLYKGLKNSDISFTAADTLYKDLEKLIKTDYENIYVVGIRIKDDYKNELKLVLESLTKNKKNIKFLILKDRFEVKGSDTNFFIPYLMQMDSGKKGQRLPDIINKNFKIQESDYLRLKELFEYFELKDEDKKPKKIDEIIKLAKYMAYTIDTHWKWHAAEETDLSLMIKKIANNEVTDEEINLAQKYDPDNYMLTGTSKQITELCEKIKIVAKYDNAPVLIYGETGVGKEVAARLLHKGSKRCEKAFVAVNCAGIPANLMEDMLFGHKKGAFTDAKEDKKGLFEAADGGTIFLDEITEMSMEVQAKLLRFLEDFNIIPLGTTETKKVDVRIIAATNENIKEKINEKKFRADLYYRISGVELYIPSLRERKEDIKQIANVILYRFYEEYGFKRRILSKKEIAILESYDWPGNVRQLQKFLMRCIIFNAKDNEFIKILKEITSDNVKFNEDTITDNKIITIAEAEKSAIKSALKICNWNKTIAAKELGIALNTLKAKMEEFGIKK